MDNISVAHNVGECGDKAVRLLGHNVLVRKCVRPDLTDEQGEVLVALCEKTKDRTCWCEVLAVGPECGKPRRNMSKAELRRRDIPFCLNFIAKTGDLVVLPESSKREMMWRGVCGEDSELIVDECELIALLPSEEPEK